MAAGAEAGRDLQSRIEATRHLCFEAVRVYIGIALFLKGVFFVMDREFLADILQRSGLTLGQMYLLHYIPIAHLAGGLLLAVGLLTRVSALFQIPILAGAVFLVHLREGLFTHGQSLELTALVLFLLVLIVVHGGGRLSVDHYILKQWRARIAER